MTARRTLLAMAAAGFAVPAASQSVATRSSLRAAIILSNPVLVTRGPDGAPGGVSVAFARALAGRLGLPLQLVPYDNPARYNESLGRDEWDIGLAARDPSRAQYLDFSAPFMEVDNGYVARPGTSLVRAEEVDRAGIRVAVAQGSAPDGFLTRTLRLAEIVRVPGGLDPARAVLAEGRADVYGDNLHVAHRIAEALPGAGVLEGRFNLVLMSVAVPKARAEALPAIDAFVAESIRNGLIASLIAGAGLRGVRAPV